MSCFTPTRSASPQGLLTGLPALGAAGFEFPGTSSDSQDGTVSWEAPVTTCVVKALPGASVTVTQRVLASEFRREVARVTPRSPAAFSLCKTQARLGALPSRQPPSPAFPLFSCRSRAPVDQMASGGRPP